MWPVGDALAALGVDRDAPWALEPLASGAYHEHVVLVAGGRRAVLRRCRASQWGLPPREQLAREEATLRALAGSGVAPRPLALLDEVLVEELVDGRPFAYATDLPALGRALAVAHGHAPSHLPVVDARAELLADGSAWLARAAPRDAEAVALLRELSGRAGSGGRDAGVPALVHTDLNTGNLLVAGDGAVRLVDWEAARRGDPAWDLAHALSPTTTAWVAASACVLGPADAGALLAGYGDDAVAARVGPLLDAVIFRALAWCLGFAAGRPEDADEPMDRSLERFRDPSWVASCLGARAVLRLA